MHYIYISLIKNIIFFLFKIFKSIFNSRTLAHTQTHISDKIMFVKVDAWALATDFPKCHLLNDRRYLTNTKPLQSISLKQYTLETLADHPNKPDLAVVYKRSPC